MKSQVEINNEYANGLLKDAFFRNDICDVKKAVNMGAYIFVIDSKSMRDAVENGHLEVVNFLVSKVHGTKIRWRPTSVMTIVFCAKRSIQRFFKRLFSIVKDKFK